MQLPIYRPAFYLLIILLLAACGEETQKKECRFGKPQAIFQSAFENVEKTTFSLKGREGVENVIFKNGVSLALIQSGCNELRQEFSFRLPMTNSEANGEFWIIQGEQLMRFLGNTDASLVQFSEWANAIKQVSGQLKLGEALEIQTGYFVTVDKIEFPEETIVKVILEGR